MADKKTQAEAPKKSGSNKGILIAFIIILLVINLVQLFFNVTQKNEIETKSKTIADNAVKIDSLNVQLENSIKDLEEKKLEIEKLGGDVTLLTEQIAELTAAKDELKKSRDSYASRYNAIKDKIDAANRIREDADRQVEQLKYQLAQQDTIITTQKNTIVLREDSINKINSEKKVLADKVAIASVLKAEKFITEAISSKGKATAGTSFKGKKIDKIRTTFFLGENKVADKGGKDIFFRLIEPGGSALFDLANGGGSFEFGGKEVFYTMKQTILFENNNQKMSFEYNKGTDYKAGNHTIEIYCEGFKIGTSTFVVK